MPAPTRKLLSPRISFLIVVAISFSVFLLPHPVIALTYTWTNQAVPARTAGFRIAAVRPVA